MGLTIDVGITALEPDEPDGHRPTTLSTVSDLVSAAGLGTFSEPHSDEYLEWSCGSSTHRLPARLPAPRGAAEIFRLFRKPFGSSKTARRRFDHLVWHADSMGFYVPEDRSVSEHEFADEIIALGALGEAARASVRTASAIVFA